MLTVLPGSWAGCSWMEGSYGKLAGRTLRSLCMGGSHDAGMSRLNGHTAFCTGDNTLTQVVVCLWCLVASTILGSAYGCAAPCFEYWAEVGSV